MLDFIRGVAPCGWKDIKWTKNGKIVVPDIRVDRFSVQCAKALSKLCSTMHISTIIPGTERS